jgi:hypothetical protein
VFSGSGINTARVPSLICKQDVAFCSVQVVTVVKQRWILFVLLAWFALCSTTGASDWEAHSTGTLGGTAKAQIAGRSCLAQQTCSTLRLRLVYTWSTFGLHAGTTPNDRKNTSDCNRHCISTQAAKSRAQCHRFVATNCCTVPLPFLLRNRLLKEKLPMILTCAHSLHATIISTV